MLMLFQEWIGESMNDMISTMEDYPRDTIKLLDARAHLRNIQRLASILDEAFVLYLSSVRAEDTLELVQHRAQRDSGNLTAANAANGLPNPDSDSDSTKWTSEDEANLNTILAKRLDANLAKSKGGE